MEKDKLKLTPEEENSLTQPLIAMGTDLLNNENVSREDIIKLYLYSQQNCKMLMARLEGRKDKKKILLNPDTLTKLKRFMNASRVHPLAGGQRFKSEDDAISFLLSVALKLGVNFLESMLNDDNFKSVTSSMEPETFDDKAKRNEKIEKEFEENVD